MALPTTITVPTSQGVLYTPPEATTAIIAGLHVANANVSARTFTVYLRARGGTATPISAVSQSLAAGAIAIYGEELRLPSGCVLEGIASGSDVTCVITGEEKRN
jgi:hypothetical protein